MNEMRNKDSLARNLYSDENFLKDPHANKNNNLPDLSQNNREGSAQQYFIPVDYETFAKWQQQVAEGIIATK